MAKQKNTELKRVNINLPLSTIEKVKDYADSLGNKCIYCFIKSSLGPKRYNE